MHYLMIEESTEQPSGKVNVLAALRKVTTVNDLSPFTFFQQGAWVHSLCIFEDLRYSNRTVTYSNW